MDVVSKNVRSRIMASVHSSGNKSTETIFLHLLQDNKINGWRRKHPVIGKPDFAFPKNKIAIFIDGCFWHGCPYHYRMPKNNKAYWKRKIRANKIRDKLVIKTLSRNGWRAIRFWEHELLRSAHCLKKLKGAFCPAQCFRNKNIALA